MQTRNANPGEIEFFVKLESKVWAALTSGDARADEDLLTEDFLGVYSTGFAGRDAHVGQLQFGPTVRAYSLSRARVGIPPLFRTLPMSANMAQEVVNGEASFYPGV